MTMATGLGGWVRHDGGYQSITRTICNTSPHGSNQSSEDLYFIDIDIARSRGIEINLSGYKLKLCPPYFFFYFPSKLEIIENFASKYR